MSGKEALQLIEENLTSVNPKIKGALITIKKGLDVLDIIQYQAIKYDDCVCIDGLFYEPEVMEWCE